jgi:hypothetical protein
MLQLIKKHVEGGVFTPEEVRILVAAFDAAWESIRRSGAQISDYQIEDARNLLAKTIIEAAFQGERDENRLAERALLAYAEFKNRM